MKKRELVYIGILTVIIAVMELTAIPSAFFINIQIADIEPFYFTLMVNFLLIGVIAFIFKKFLCPNLKLGFTKTGLSQGFKKYGIICCVVGVLSFISFYLGLSPFDLQPSFAKVLTEGVIYYIGVAIIEELYVRGLLLNLIEKICSKNKNSTLIAVVLSSVIFGVGHIVGVLGQPVPVIIGKIIWTIGMGMFFGMLYKKSNNLWLPIIAHFFINLCAIPYCFSSIQGYADITLLIEVPLYFALGVYSIIQLKKNNLLR